MEDFYKCDPNKNINCPKKGCQQDCFLTTKKEFAQPSQSEEMVKFLFPFGEGIHLR